MTGLQSPGFQRPGPGPDKGSLIGAQLWLVLVSLNSVLRVLVRMWISGKAQAINVKRWDINVTAPLEHGLAVAQS